MEEVQGAASSAVFLPPFFQDTWPRVQLLCVERNAPCRWTWPWTKANLRCLQRNDRAMIRQICNVKPRKIVTISFSELLAQLGTEDLDLIQQERRLRWYGHVKRSFGAVKTACGIQVDGKRGPGRPKITWKQLTEGLQRVEALCYQPS